MKVLYDAMSRMEWHVPSTTYLFVDKMPTFMHAADVLVSKAGGLITTEALACGLPMVLIDVIPGQEEGNAQYVVEGGAGVIADDPLDLLEYTFHWLQNDGATLKQTAERARALGRPNAATEVAQMAMKAAEMSARWREEREESGETSLLSLTDLRAMLSRFGIGEKTSGAQRYS